MGQETQKFFGQYGEFVIMNTGVSVFGLVTVGLG